MSQLTIWTIFALAFLVTLLRGAGWAFVLVYLPAMLLLSQLPEIQIAHAPMSAQFGPIYAILLALPFRRESLRIRWCSIDTIVVLLLISSTITAWNTEVFETGINNFRNELMTWVGPYFLARIVFRSVDIRRAALHVLTGVMAIISVAALIEFRLIPYFYLHVLQDMGMGNYIHAMAYSRYGFFRVAGPVAHPIYFGNTCLVLLGMVAVLAKTSGKSLKNPWVALTLFGAFGCLVTSISFTPYIGLVAGTAFFLTLMLVPFARKLVIPLTLLVIAIMFTFTYTVAHQKLGEKPDGELQASLYIRKTIIHESWKQAVNAGAFGFGKNYDFHEDEDFDLSSVDNSYMLFTMTRGWVYTCLWISIAIFFSLRMTLAFGRVTHRSQIFPLSVATATILALMVSMFTVWGGALYVVVWAIMLGLSNTLMDMVLDPDLLRAPTGPHGLRALPRHPPGRRPVLTGAASKPMPMGQS
jgi:hypothetical protein